jgi:hypothetical protein
MSRVAAGGAFHQHGPIGRERLGRRFAGFSANDRSVTLVRRTKLSIERTLQPFGEVAESFRGFTQLRVLFLELADTRYALLDRLGWLRVDHYASSDANDRSASEAVALRAAGGPPSQPEDVTVSP